MGSVLERAAARRHHVIWGKVKRRRLRRPKVSMVQRAGKAKTKLTRPKPQEARRDWKKVKLGGVLVSGLCGWRGAVLP